MALPGNYAHRKLQDPCWGSVVKVVGGPSLPLAAWKTLNPGPFSLTSSELCFRHYHSPKLTLGLSASPHQNFVSGIVIAQSQARLLVQVACLALVFLMCERMQQMAVICQFASLFAAQPDLFLMYPLPTGLLSKQGAHKGPHGSHAKKQVQEGIQTQVGRLVLPSPMCAQAGSVVYYNTSGGVESKDKLKLQCQEVCVLRQPALGARSFARLCFGAAHCKRELFAGHGAGYATWLHPLAHAILWAARRAFCAPDGPSGCVLVCHGCVQIVCS